MNPGPRAQINEDRTSILGAGTNHFIAPWGEQVEGPSNARGTKSYYPTRPTEPCENFLKYCQDCGLTWLVGAAGSEAALNHPCHYECTYASGDTTRYLIVFTDGGCDFERQDGCTTLTSVGVYFGPGSPHNISKRINDARLRRISEPRIQAAIEALRHVRQIIEPTRQALILHTFPGRREAYRRDKRKFRVVIATDSSDLVNCVCRKMKDWTLTDGVYKNKEGRVVEDSEGFVQLDHEVDALSRVGVQVMWHYVPVLNNHEARWLAQAALSPPVRVYLR
ncbi:hypothetical protein F4776DRAFT_324207 [Hypoxylon sp. NC0597]|nr:hypothetical protein F4776DRAFT_324207 [Hypoxylon sp. NC0597]